MTNRTIHSIDDRVCTTRRKINSPTFPSRRRQIMTEPKQTTDTNHVSEMRKRAVDGQKNRRSKNLRWLIIYYLKSYPGLHLEIVEHGEHPTEAEQAIRELIEHEQFTEISREEHVEEVPLQ